MESAAERHRPSARRDRRSTQCVGAFLGALFSALALTGGAAAQTSQADAQPDTDKGCGDHPTKLDMEPPAPDQPQPRWACEQPELEIEPVWLGKPAEFVFKVRNAGEGVLNIKVRKP